MAQLMFEELEFHDGILGCLECIVPLRATMNAKQGK